MLGAEQRDDRLFAVEISGVRSAVPAGETCAPNGDSVHRFRRRAAGQSSVLRSFPKLIATVA
jgi:hypothetical protein